MNGAAALGLMLCASAVAACGRAGTAPESHEVLVPAGDFIAGADCEPGHVEPGCGSALHARRRVTLPAFYADRELVTRTEYAACVRAGACVDDVEAPSIRGTPSSDPERRAVEDFVNALAFVRQEHAAQYCARRGARLPTGDEFERLARGTDGRMTTRVCEEDTLACANGQGPSGVRGLEFVQWISLRDHLFPYGAAMGGTPAAYGATKQVWPDHDANPYAAFRCVRDVDPSRPSTNVGHANP